MYHYLVSDAHRFNAAFPAGSTLADMAGTGSRARFRLVTHVGNRKEYRMDGTGYRFTVHKVGV